VCLIRGRDCLPIACTWVYPRCFVGSVLLIVFSFLRFDVFLCFVCLDPCGPQSKQLPNCLKIAETSVVLNVFKGASSVMSALTLLPFLSVAQQESGTRKAIFWSVTIYKKKLSSQCNLTAQIEPVQDK
jgi:hypothetical protein